MQLILKPVSHPDLGEIIVNDSLFAVGRHEMPFSNYDPQLVRKLSRRHARIFEQDGIVYVADLGSLNGTTVNGRAVDKLPVRLQRADELCFTGLCYQIEILGAAANRAFKEPAASPVKLVLMPENQPEALEPIVVTQFPFLVNKNSEVFSRYAQSMPEQLRYISRRHAHIFLREQNLYIEDLGSTNGTYVSGQRLEEHACRLRDGEVLAFGGDRFVYRVQLVYEQEPSAREDPVTSGQLTAQVEGIEDVTRTTFVTSANSFLDIFCVDEESAEDSGNPALGDSAAQAVLGDAASGTGASGRMGRWRTIVRESRNAFSDDESGGLKWGRFAIAAIMAAGIAASGVYFVNAPERDIRELLQGGEYQAAAVAADAYLESHAQDGDISALATEAMLKAVVPGWMARLTAGEFPQAQREIEDGRQLSRSNPSAEKLLDVMQWATRLEQFIVERGGVDAPFVMFEHEQAVNELLDWWEADDKIHRRSLGTIAQQVPEFVALRSQLFSHLRKIHSQQSLDVAAIDRLLGTVEDRLKAGEATRLQVEFVEFGNRYPGIRGIQVLQNDLDLYLVIDADIKAMNWFQARRRVDAAGFETPPFRRHIQFVSEKLLPPQQLAGRYDEALNAWQDGELDRATSLLEGLTEEPWGEPARRRLDDNRKRRADFENLKSLKGSPDYEKQLLLFYSSLDPVLEGYFIEAVEDEFQTHRGNALSKAKKAFTRAQSDWKKYRDKGGIRGLHRLESKVSPAFRQLAALLSDAYEQIAYAVQVYRLLDTAYPDSWNELEQRVLKEVRLQRRSLAELAMVLEPSLKEAKLELLPVVQSEIPGKMSDNSSEYEP